MCLFLKYNCIGCLRRDNLLFIREKSREKSVIPSLLPAIFDGVCELVAVKMRSLIELKYNTISDAAAEIGSPAQIRETFVGFQKYLYQV